ncbi:skin secretory protein xP2-like [Equus caballus]|uniref:skin secretory protein xP2-like n=1 Tax=Equus caballus TaxID=9796 RepID=UPI0038B2BA80
MFLCCLPICRGRSLSRARKERPGRKGGLLSRSRRLWTFVRRDTERSTQDTESSSPREEKLGRNSVAAGVGKRLPSSGTVAQGSEPAQAPARVRGAQSHPAAPAQGQETSSAPGWERGEPAPPQAPAGAMQPALMEPAEQGEPSPAPAPASALGQAEVVAREQGEPSPALAPASAPGQAEVVAREQGEPSPALAPASAPGQAEVVAREQGEPSPALAPASARGRLKWSPGSRESHPLLQSLLEPWSPLRPQHCPRESSLSNPLHPQLLTHPFHLLPHHDLPSSPCFPCMSV